MKKIFNLSLLTIATIFLSSCLKDKMVEDQKYGLINLNANKFVEFNETSLSFALPFKDVQSILEIPIHLAGEKVAAEDVNVVVSLANSVQLINKYNTDNDQELEPFPTSLYQLQGTGLNVVIPKGSKNGYIKVKVNASTFDPSSTYALGLTIMSVTDGYVISGNYKTSVVSFGAKNSYDGVYTVTGTMVDANGAYKGVYPNVFSLTTTSGTRVTVYDVDSDYDRYLIKSIASGGLANTGIAVALTFDPVTNQLVSVSDFIAPARVFTGVSGSFDPATRKIIVNWTSGRWKVSETWTFKEDR